MMMVEFTVNIPQVDWKYLNSSLLTKVNTAPPVMTTAGANCLRNEVGRGEKRRSSKGQGERGKVRGEKQGERGGGGEGRRNGEGW